MTFYDTHPLNRPHLYDALSVSFIARYWDRTSQAFELAYDNNAQTGFVVQIIYNNTLIYEETTNSNGETPSVALPALLADEPLTVTLDMVGFDDGKGPFTETFSIQLLTDRLRTLGAPLQLRMKRKISDNHQLFYADAYDEDPENIGEIDSWLRFDDDFDPNHFNILVEGDSWFHYPIPKNTDLRQVCLAALRGRVKSKTVSVLELQHFGDRATSVLPPPGGMLDTSSESYKLLLEWATQYRFDAVLLSAGGNDFADPGFSTDVDEWEGDLQPYINHVLEGPQEEHVFDPYAASLANVDMANANIAMEQSFSALLNNHYWNKYLSNIPYLDIENSHIVQDTPRSRLQPPDIDAGIISVLDNVIPNTGFVDWTFDALLNNWPAGSEFPYGHNGPVDDALELIFDRQRVMDRVNAIYHGYSDFIKDLTKAGITRIVAHSYAYPIYNEFATHIYMGARTGNWRRKAGPWLNIRLIEAGINNKFVRSFALKGLIDIVSREVLHRLDSDLANFVFVDLRNIAVLPDHWRDEMHLDVGGFEPCGEAIANRIAALFAADFN